MNPLWYYFYGFIIVWVIAFFLRGRYNITIDGIVIMLKTERLKGLIDSVAKRCPRVWKMYMNIGIPVGIVLIVVMVISIIYSIQLMFETPTVALVLPGVDIPGSPIYIPFASGLIALATVMIIHEGGHGVLARCENVAIDSVGLLLLIIIPGAFVEPNEDEVKKINGISRLRIYFAGPMFNILLCVIALAVTLSISGFIADENMYTTDGVEISSVVPASPAEGVLSEGMVIYSVNNQTVTNATSFTASMSDVSVGDNVTLSTDQGDYTITTTENPNNSSSAYLGVRSQGHTVVAPEAREKYGTTLPAILSQLEELFYLIFFLNFAVGTFNLLPMKPLDGGLIFEELLRIRIRQDRRKDFNHTLNRWTRFLPMGMRCWISRRFNSLLNFISAHELTEERVTQITRIVSYILIVILIVLILYGLVPGILELL